MSAKTWLTVLSGLLVVLCCPLIAADVPPDSDVDLTAGVLRHEFTNSVGMRFALVKAGTFVMGSPEDEKQREPYGKGSEQQHEVEITRDFYLGVHEVTQKQYRTVMGYNPSHFSHDGKPAPKGSYTTGQKPGGGKEKVKGFDTDDFPTDSVSWEDAQEFLLKLTLLAAERKFKMTYCLPTEAQWEYACRGGHLSKDRNKAQLPFHFKEPSASLGSGQANFYATFPYGGGKAGVYIKRTNTVAKNGEANPLGLYDMHGNLMEWCQDWYDPKYYASSPRKDPPGPDSGSQRVLRGGDWSHRGENCRTARRLCDDPSQRTCWFGFRVAAVRHN